MSACIKSDLSNINTQGIAITPEYAFSVALYTIDFSEYLPDGFEQSPVADTAGYAIDSLLMYQNGFFENPFRLSYSLLQPFVMNQTPELDNIISAMFRFRLQNAIPAQIFVQAYFLDANQVALDSFFVEPLLIEGAEVNSEGIVTSASAMQTEDVFLDSLQIQKLYATTQFLIQTTVEIPKPTDFFIQYNSEQLLFLEMAAKIKLRISM